MVTPKLKADIAKGDTGKVVGISECAEVTSKHETNVHGAAEGTLKHD